MSEVKSGGEAVMYVVLMGRPGSGKGTQSQGLIRWLGVPHLSTGEMLRAASQQNTRLGRRVAACIESGNLASDELIMELVAERLQAEDCRQGCLLDGVPRTLAQAEALDRLLGESEAQVDAAIQLDADGEVLVDRILRRAEIEGRSDDTVETIRRRMEVYETETAPILDYYDGRGVLFRVDALGTPEQVFARIKACLAGHPGLLDRATEQSDAN